jgi:hypothetical protein
MKNKSLKTCLIEAIERAQSMGNHTHVDVLKPIIEKIKTLVRAEEIDDSSILELENKIIEKYLDDLLKEKRELLYKLSNKKKLKELEIESYNYSVINYYYKDCCNNN